MERKQKKRDRTSSGHTTKKIHQQFQDNWSDYQNTFNKLQEQLKKYLESITSHVYASKKKNDAEHFRIHVTKIQQELTATTPPPAISSDLIDSLRQIETVMYMNPDSSIEHKLRPLLQLSKETYTLEFILKTYFQTDLNNNFYDNDTNPERISIMKYFKQYFQEYVVFVNMVNEFTYPKRKSSNAFLQDKINDFVFRSSSNNTYDFVDLCDAVRDNKLKSRNDVNVGVTLFYDAKTKTRYEAYVYVTVIGGELNHSNMDEISCGIKDHDLGTNIKMFWNTGYSEVNKSTHSYYELPTGNTSKGKTQRKKQKAGSLSKNRTRTGVKRVEPLCGSERILDSLSRIPFAKNGNPTTNA